MIPNESYRRGEGRCRVGLFGNYGGQNFGDEIMGIMFAKTLQALGVSFSVFGLRAQYGERYGFPVVYSATELVRMCDVIIVGGGGLLLPHRGAASNFGREMDALLKECNDRSIPLLCFSIGGAGLPVERLSPTSRRHLLERAKRCTLRLRSELPMLSQAGTTGAHHEDVVWMSSLFFPLKTGKAKASGRPRIGISMYPEGKLNRKLQENFFRLLVRMRSDCDFVFFEVKSSKRGKGQALCPDKILNLPNCSFFKFESVENGIGFLVTLDLLLTSRLHVLMVAMSYRIPSVSLLPRTKTVLCLQELGLNEFCWVGRRLWRLLYLFNSYLLRRLIRSFEKFDPVHLQLDAALHFRDLELSLRDLGVLHANKEDNRPIEEPER